MTLELADFDLEILNLIIKYMNPIDQVSLAKTNKLFYERIKKLWRTTWKRVNLNKIELLHENFPFFFNYVLSRNTYHIIARIKQFNEFLTLSLSKKVVNLKRLEIRGDNWNRLVDFYNLSYQCPNIVELLLDNVAVDTYCLISLKNLRVLRLNECSMDDDRSLELIIKNLNLEQLDMRVKNPNYTNNVLLSKSRCRKLETLRILQYHLAQHLTDILELKNLKILFISCLCADMLLNTQLLTEILESKKESVFSFAIYSLKPTDDIFINILTMENLRSLELYNMMVTFLPNLANLTKLRSLYLNESYGFTRMCLLKFVSENQSNQLTLISLYGCKKLHEDAFWPIGEFLQNIDTFRLTPLNFNIQKTNVCKTVLEHESCKKYQNVMNLKDKRKGIRKDADINGVYILNFN